MMVQWSADRKLEVVWPDLYAQTKPRVWATQDSEPPWSCPDHDPIRLNRLQHQIARARSVGPGLRRDDVLMDFAS
jgi:hypothetical protein